MDLRVRRRLAQRSIRNVRSAKDRSWEENMRCNLVGLPRAALLALGANLAGAGSPAPSGRFAMAWHVTLAPSWFDPSTAPPQITPFGILYATHEALVRPYPGFKMGPSLAESWDE